MTLHKAIALKSEEVFGALQELCELESMKARAAMMGDFGFQLAIDYERRKDRAWKRALDVFEKYRTDKPLVRCI